MHPLRSFPPLIFSSNRWLARHFGKTLRLSVSLLVVVLWRRAPSFAFGCVSSGRGSHTKSLSGWLNYVSPHIFNECEWILGTQKNAKERTRALFNESSFMQKNERDARTHTRTNTSRTQNNTQRADFTNERSERTGDVIQLRNKSKGLIRIMNRNAAHPSSLYQLGSFISPASRVPRLQSPISGLHDTRSPTPTAANANSMADFAARLLFHLMPRLLSPSGHAPARAA